MAPDRGTEDDGLRARVAEIVDAHDVEGLLALGAPPDEYAAEIDALTGLVRSGAVSNPTVAEYWDSRFGPSSAAQGHRDALAALAAALTALRP